MNNADNIRIAIDWRIGNVAPVPDEFDINEDYLNRLTKEEFIAAFRHLQETVINIYNEIKKNPFEWGYPDDERATFDLKRRDYRRLAIFLEAIAKAGRPESDTLVINRAEYNKRAKSIKKPKPLIEKLIDFGFKLDGIYDKSSEFTVAFPSKPQILSVLYAYDKAIGDVNQHESAYYLYFESFSYRWFEINNKYDTCFLVYVDRLKDELQRIHYWLYNRAIELGFKINEKKPLDKGCPYYTKGSKKLLALSRCTDYGMLDFDDNKDYDKDRYFAKAIFRKVFVKYPEKVNELYKLIPEPFIGNAANCTRCGGRKKPDEECSMRICYAIDNVYKEMCAYKVFFFYNPTLEDFKKIFSLYLVENNIK